MTVEALRAGLQQEVLSFGSFRLFPIERRLEQNGVQVKIHDRALDILIVLVRNAGETLSNARVIEEVWPDSLVGEANLRVHMVSLRKILARPEARNPCIENIPGRGYRFALPVSREEIARTWPKPSEPTVKQPLRIVGREEAVRDVVDRLLQKRFVTIVGTGGIGKTTVALVVTNVFSQRHGHVVHFIDLGMVNDPALVVKALAFGIGVASQSGNALSSVKKALKHRQAVILLDGCEHLVDEVARLAEELFLDVPSVRILATSREALRAAGEHVYWLAPLKTPPEAPTLTADEAVSFPAVQLFVERASNGSYEFRLSDADAMAVASICRQLDGIALAIELAAGRVAAYGIDGILIRLQDRFRLLTNGERAALPRHQTLQATIDWSYNLLAEREKVTLRRLAIFAGPFTFEAARAIAEDDEVATAREFLSTFANLVAKSLISSDELHKTNHYRLLDTTRHYMRDKLLESGEMSQIANRHANHYQRYLPDFEELAHEQKDFLHAAKYAADIANVVAGLQWCFSQRETYRTGVHLVAASAPLFLEVSLLKDCLPWVELAITNLDELDKGSHLEMRLQAFLGSFLMFARGNPEEARLAILRGLELAERLGDVIYRARLTDGLYVFYIRRGNLPDAMRIAYENSSQPDYNGTSAGGHDWMRCVSANFAGNHDEAIAYGERLLPILPVSRRVYAHNFSIDHRVHVLAAYARSLWPRGFPEKALLAVNQLVVEAEELDHPVSICIALACAIAPAIWAGELGLAAEITDRLESVATRHLLPHFETSALAWRGALFIRGGQASRGVPLLQQSLNAQDAGGQALMRTSFLVEMANGQAATGQLDEALTTIDEAVHRIDRIGEGILLPEALRIKAEIVQLLHGAASRRAEEFLHRSLDHARRQFALSWELRSALSLVRMRLHPGGDGDARNLVAEVLNRFTEGFDTADLRSARNLLEQ